MIIDKKNRAIGEWYLESEESFSTIGINELEKAMKMLTGILEILYSKSLYYPKAVLLREWVPKDTIIQTSLLNGAKEFVIDISDCQINEIQSTVLEEVKVLQERFGVLPWKLQFLGNGVVHLPDGENKFSENLFWVTLDMVMGYVIVIHTQADIWMPYDIKGNTQYETYQLNAPRLEDVLKSLEKESGLSIEVDDEPTDYAKSYKYGLQNFTDSNNNPINIINSLNINLIEE